MRRAVWIGAVVLMGLVGCSPPTEKAPVVRPVRAIKAGDSAAFVGRSFPGTARATEVVELSFRVAGPLITRPIIVGDVVTEGQVLARLDPRDFEVDLRNIQAQLSQAKARLVLSEDQYARAQDAHARQAVSEIELAREMARRDTEQANVEALEASVDSARDALDDTNLVAPFAGTVVAIYVENFEYVQSRQSICRIVDDSRIEMIIDIPEHLISLARHVGGIMCVFDAAPGLEVPAQVKEIGKEASELTRTFPVTLIMDQPEGFRILAGMAGVARSEGVKTSEPELQGIEIPVSAVVSIDGEASFVWTIDPSTMRVARQNVTVVAFTESGVLIDGIAPGTWIATAGAHYLQDGQEVRIMDAAAAGAPA